MKTNERELLMRVKRLTKGAKIQTDNIEQEKRNVIKAFNKSSVNKYLGQVVNIWEFKPHPDTKNLKGEFGGKCNITACQRDHSAFFWNYGTLAYYCVDCALDIYRHEKRDIFNFKVIDEIPLLMAVDTNEFIVTKPN